MIHIQKRTFLARQLDLMFTHGHEVELVTRGMTHTQIWVHIDGRIWADDVHAKCMHLWKPQAMAFHDYCWAMLKANIEPLGAPI